MNTTNDYLEKLITFRKYLHSRPELSKNEHETAKEIKDFVTSNHPDGLVEGIGGAGFAAVYNGKNPGKTLLLRADTDALPIAEVNTFDHKSIYAGVSHKCGHDGHSSILAGMSGVLKENPPARGRVVLLFQPAEEIGEGAKAVINDPKFVEIEPDIVFGFHNLPGFAKNSIVVRDAHFASASKGMIVKLFGKTSHAANPELGISPALAVAEIIQKLSALSSSKHDFEDFKLITLIYSRMGQIAFGTTPGYAEVMATLRSFRNDDMEILRRKSVQIVEAAADRFGLSEELSWTEEFPATVNHKKYSAIVRACASEMALDLVTPEMPFRWSEDFGYFTIKYPGAMFGVGAGINHPALHHPDYDFPDAIIPTTMKMFDAIIRKVLR